MKQILWLKTLIWGFIAGVLAGLAMLLTMALLRLFLGWPTPTELIFDRIFPLLTVEFFIGSLVRAGGYTPLKLQGVFGAVTAQVIVAGLGGVLYAFYLKYRDRRRFAAYRQLIARRARFVFDNSWCSSRDGPLRRLTLADASHQLPRLSAGPRARHCFSGNANFVFSFRARDHVFLWFVKQVSAHGDGGRTRNRGGAIGRSPPLCRAWNRSGPRTRAW